LVNTILVDGTENVFTLLINYVLRLDATIGMNEEERCDKTYMHACNACRVYVCLCAD
jgi:hypothetical protein